MILDPLLFMFWQISAQQTATPRTNLKLATQVCSNRVRRRRAMTQVQTELSTAMAQDIPTDILIRRQSAFRQTIASHASVASRFLRATKPMEWTRIGLQESSALLQGVPRSSSKHLWSKLSRSTDLARPISSTQCLVSTSQRSQMKQALSSHLVAMTCKNMPSKELSPMTSSGEQLWPRRDTGLSTWPR